MVVTNNYLTTKKAVTVQLAKFCKTVVTDLVIPARYAWIMAFKVLFVAHSATITELFYKHSVISETGLRWSVARPDRLIDAGVVCSILRVNLRSEETLA